MIAPVPTAEADAPELAHGDTTENPKPVPSEIKIRDNEEAAKAPPITAAQETPDESASFLPGISVRVV